MSDILDQLRNRIHDSPIPAERLMDAAAEEIERLRNCHRIISRQAGFYKPELPDHTTVEVHLGTLRAAANCATERT